MPSKSRYPEIQIPNVDIWTFLFERKTEFPESKAIYTDPVARKSYTYAEIKISTVNFGKGLKIELNWEKDDVLLLFTPNSIDTPIITWGTLWAGGIISPANPAYNSSELAIQVKDSGAKAIVTQRPLLETACAAARLAGLPYDRILLIGEDDHNKDFKHFTILCEIGSIQGSLLQRTILKSPENDLAFLVYSSGTTGHPKGVMISHRNLISNILMLKEGESVNLSWHGRYDNNGDRILGFLPFYHIYGLSSLVHQAIFNGVELIVMSRFDLVNFCTYIQRYKITLVYVVPPVVLQLAKNPIVDGFDMSSLRMMSSGAAPLTRELVDAVYKRLHIPIKQAYGLSETSPTTHSQPWDTWYQNVGSVGLLLANQTIKFMAPDESELPVGETGELWIKGPNIFKGYHNNTEATRNALTEDAYFKTGDVGYQDQNGNLYITDRVKELIKYKGFQVAPAELEGYLQSHPEIQDAAVIGVFKPDQATEVPMAFIVLVEGVSSGRVKAKQITDWLNARVAHHKHLRGGIQWAQEIPKSPSGKILRRALRSILEEQERRRARM